MAHTSSHRMFTYPICVHAPISQECLSITSILVSRFIMDLRDLHQCDRFTAITQSWKSNQISALSSFVSDLGQDLSHGFPVPEDEDDDTYGLIEDD